MSTAVNNSLNNAVNNYTYSYQGKLQAKLDKNDDANWSKDELQAYANAYEGATGKKLDVDSLMEKYANENGVIDYKSQQKMQTDDALGFNNLQKLLDEAKTTNASSSSSTSTSTATSATSEAEKKAAKEVAIEAVKRFTYDYSGKLQPLLDKNDDGVWGKDELQNYADLYNKATGKTLDVDKLIEKYGKDGAIDPTGQAAMKKADALDLSSLKVAYDAATAKPETENNGYVKPYAAYTKDTTIGNRSMKDFSINDLIGSMSPEKKMAFSLKVNQYENMGNLLNTMTGGYSSSAALNIATMSTPSSAASQYTLSSQMLNFTA